MSVLVVGLNHRTAPTSLLERATVAPDNLPGVLDRLTGGEHVAEAVVLSTCNRVEIYAATATFHGGVAEISGEIADVAGVPLDDLSSHLYVHHDARAVQHLFAVSCGLDSMLVGESQILGQVRSAFRTAQDQDAVGRVLGELFRQALRVGKRARSETGIDRAGASIVGVGVDLAGEAVGGLAGRSVLLVGAGSTGALAGATLRRAGAGEIVVANRSRERAERLAASLEGRPVGLAEVPGELARADVVVCSTASTALQLPVDVVAPTLAGRRVVFLDLALPRDVDPAVRALPGATLVDLETLRGSLDGGPGGGDVDAVRAIVTEEVAVFGGWERAVTVAPTVTALRAKASAVVADELARFAGRVPGLDDRVRAEVTVTVNRVVDKLLHGPTVRVKELAGEPGGDSYAAALRELFGLDPRALSVVSSPEPGDLP